VHILFSKNHDCGYFRLSLRDGTFASTESPRRLPCSLDPLLRIRSLRLRWRRLLAALRVRGRQTLAATALRRRRVEFDRETSPPSGPRVRPTHPNAPRLILQPFQSAGDTNARP